MLHTNNTISLEDTVNVYGNGKGGVGKTSDCQTGIEYAIQRGLVPAIAQVDEQGRLEALNASHVLTITIDPKAARENPNLELQRFGPLSDLMVDTPKGRPIFIDLGANEDQRFAYWSRQAEVSEDIAESGRQVVLHIVYTSEQEAIEKAGTTARDLMRSLPVAKLCLVENQRFGRISDLVAGSAAHDAYQQHIQTLLPNAHLIRMPRIRGNSYARFEQARIPFSRVAQMRTAEVMDITGLGRADARIVRGDVSEWLEQMFLQLDQLFGA
ncbi:hypothetical protein KD146_13845 [Devosia sp. BSSL-BM10]|uniref:CobQ/CobB/MinD/ParA nucleotide binding domain-containing protein n=1 Tax=Devosia litorisediminis TaxID=2829817 RepID=A0A942E9C2_9HYPH|nr:hypothetical protein [Devosia litorisediminis]MBS3849782.1 hypothetical protein [Devosia litorisediminis]